MATDDWFWGLGGWAARHAARFPRADWPGFEAEFWAELRHALVKCGATEDVAEEASRRLFESPPGFVSDHPAAILGQVRAIHRERRAAAAPAARPRRPEEDNAAWDAAAAANWARLGEEERECWRDLARCRGLPFARSPEALDLLASAWAYDQSWIISLPQPGQAPAPKRGPGPRHVLDPQTQTPKGS